MRPRIYGMEVSRGLTRYIPTVGPAELKEYPPTDELWVGYKQIYDQTTGRGFGATAVPAHTRSRKKYKRMAKPMRRRAAPPPSPRCWSDLDLDCAKGDKVKCWTWPDGQVCCLCQTSPGKYYVNTKPGTIPDVPQRPGRRLAQPGCSTHADCEDVTQRTTIPHLCINGNCMQIRGAHRGVRQGI